MTSRSSREPVEPEAQEPEEPAQEDEPVDLHSEEFAETEPRRRTSAEVPSAASAAARTASRPA